MRLPSVYAGLGMSECGRTAMGDSVTDEIKLTSHHRATVEKIFQHPISHNLQWHDVLSLLESVGEVVEGRDRRFKVTVGTETETLDAPPGHDLDAQMVVDIRRMLEGAGITPE